MKTVLTIAGSDSSGGAGIQADIKTLMANGVYAMSAITALTAQNTLGVRAIQEATPAFLRAQLNAVFEDIPPDAVKIGMVSSPELICVIADRLQHFKAKNIVVDPVMVATSGAALMKDRALSAMCRHLLPIATVITPNIPEAEVLCGYAIQAPGDMERAARELSERFSAAVLLKGGHGTEDAKDLLCTRDTIFRFSARRIQNPNTHGTGCTLSSAIAANLAKGYSLEQAVKRAKDYVTGAILSGLNLGRGAGPLNHGFCLAGIFLPEE